MRRRNRKRASAPRWGRALAVLAAIVLLVASPAVASAAPLDGAPAVAVYTASAVGTVVVLALVAGLGLYAAAGLGLIGERSRLVMRRRLRVVFGVTFLLAAVTPHVALNFSIATMGAFVAGAGLVVAGWVWGASRRQRLESESSVSGTSASS